ncbi:MAG: hypothetical protein J1E95_08015 [Muribaculaceae bacterium]|nr:hypothetical protein [Muribaculaceae bacterium]
MIDKFKIYFNIIMLFILFTGCSDNDMEHDETDSDKAVVFGATLRELRGSRESDGDLIKDRSFNLLFKGESGYEEGRVDFNSSGIGYSLRLDSDGNGFTDLVWGYVSPEETGGYSFYVDNFKFPFNGSTIVKLPENPDENPYNIKVFEKDFQSNDLVWGSLENADRANIEIIDLYHVMSRFQLHLYVNNEAVGSVFTPVSAGITNIFRCPVSFDRITGTFGLKTDIEGKIQPDEEEFMLVEPNGWTTKWDEKGNQYYASPEYILTPQEFASDNRPRLNITLNDGEKDRVFTGLFPPVMTVYDENNENGTLWTMSFKRGTRLILTVSVSNDMATLQFLPVYLIDWYEKLKNKTFTGTQASVGENEDFEKLFEAYESSTESEFYKWGYKENDDTWVFNIFNNIEIE